MSAATITVEEQVNKFSEYPETMDSYFQTKTIIIEILPKDLDPELEKKLVKFQVTSAKQYFDYLDAEISFWDEFDPNGKLKPFSHIDTLKSSKNQFMSALKYYRSNNQYYGDNELKNSFDNIKSGAVYSKTTLAKFLLKHVNETTAFINGLNQGLLSEKYHGINGISVDYLRGITTALIYTKHIKELGKATKEDISDFSERLNEANAGFSELNNRFTAAFHEHESKIQSIIDQTNNHFQDLDKKTIEYFDQKDRRCQDLEKLYEEKLRLQGPAEYWKTMEEHYNTKAWKWLWASLITTIIIIMVLIIVLVQLPDLFSKSAHWIDVFKNSAIITVITSIAIYILRLFVKMTMSSFHLARDAKERNNLTYFYLALIEKKAVTEKERSIILNSLFCRSDTGLLKGDSSPTMPGNISDLIKDLTNK